MSYHLHRVAGTTLLRGAREGATEASGEGHLWQREQQCKGLEEGGNDNMKEVNHKRPELMVLLI